MMHCIGYGANDPSTPRTLSCLGPIVFQSALEKLANADNWTWVDTLYPRDDAGEETISELNHRLGLHLTQLIADHKRFLIIGGGPDLHAGVDVILQKDIETHTLNLTTEAENIPAPKGKWVFHLFLHTNAPDEALVSPLKALLDHTNAPDEALVSPLKALLDTNPPIGIAISNVQGDPNQALTGQLIHMLGV